MEKAKPKPFLSFPQNLNLIRPQRQDPDPPFTEEELTVAEQLIHLSESTGPTASADSMASASSSTRSVNAPAKAQMDDVVEDEGLWRRNKRYRPITDVYASTVPIGSEGGGMKASRKRKGSNGVKGERVYEREMKVV